jgi:hypothetical protein
MCDKFVYIEYNDVIEGEENILNLAQKLLDNYCNETFTIFSGVNLLDKRIKYQNMIDNKNYEHILNFLTTFGGFNSAEIYWLPEHNTSTDLILYEHVGYDEINVTNNFPVELVNPKAMFTTYKTTIDFLNYVINCNSVKQETLDSIKRFFDTYQKGFIKFSTD